MNAVSNNWCPWSQKKLRKEVGIEYWYLQEVLLPLCTQSSLTRKKVGPLVNDNGGTVVGPHELAEKFNNYFASVFIVKDTLSLSSDNNLLSDVSTTKLLEVVVNETINNHEEETR